MDFSYIYDYQTKIAFYGLWVGENSRLSHNADWLDLIPVWQRCNRIAVITALDMRGKMNGWQDGRCEVGVPRHWVKISRNRRFPVEQCQRLQLIPSFDEADVADCDCSVNHWRYYETNGPLTDRSLPGSFIKPQLRNARVRLRLERILTSSAGVTALSCFHRRLA